MTTDTADNVTGSRRSFLNVALAGFSAISAIGITYPLGAYLWPAGEKSSGSGTRSMKLPLAEAPIGDAKFIRFLGKPAILVRPNEQEVFAISAICTHLGCVVKWKENQGEFVCPCHGGVFDTKGNVKSGPPPGGLPAYPVRIEDEYVVIEEA